MLESHHGGCALRERVPALNALPPAPSGTCPQVRGAWKYLEATHSSVGGLLTSYGRLRSTHERGAVGRPRTEETDVLRAAIVFTASGIDACCKMLIRESLPTLLERRSSARTRFEAFLMNEIDGPRHKPDFHGALIDPRPRDRLIDYYIEAQVRGSLQSSSDLRKRVKQTLGIPNALLNDERLVSLDSFFHVRNQVVHDMDFVSLRDAVNAPRRGAARHNRSAKHVASQCGSALSVLADIISATAVTLRAPRA